MNAALATRFGPQEFTNPVPPEFYDCGICGHYHPINWDGDCRDDANRFAGGELDDRYGADGWSEVAMPGSFEAYVDEVAALLPMSFYPDEADRAQFEPYYEAGIEAADVVKLATVNGERVAVPPYRRT